MEFKQVENARYLKAKKKVEAIKGLYIHFFFNILILPVLFYINLTFVPEFHWFWFPLLGMNIGLLVHWFNVVGFEKLGFTKNWEENKIKELMNK